MPFSASAQPVRLALVGWVAALLLPSSLAAGPLFRSKSHGFAVPGPHRDVALHDVNADTKLDHIGLTHDALIVGLGDGNGDFAAPQTTPIPASSISLAVAELNGDAHMDVAVVFTPGPMRIFHGNGDGTFAAPIEIAVTGTPSSIATGDLNEDGKADIAVTMSAQVKTSIFFGFLPTFFHPVVDVPCGTDPARVLLTDVSADGNLDLVVLNRGAGEIQVQLGDGTGTLGPGTTYTGVSAMQDVQSGDVTGDGIADLVASASSASSVLVFSGTGGGAFAYTASIPAGVAPQELVLAAVDADATLDIVSAGAGAHALSLLIAQGGGAFAPAQTIRSAFGPSLCVGADLDGNSHADLVAAGPAGVAVHLSNGDGTFGVEADTYSFATGNKELEIADLDLDGVPDLIVTSIGSVSILFGAGDGTLVAGPVFAFPTETTHPRPVTVGDVDANGWPDVVTGSRENHVGIFAGTGNRSFTPLPPVVMPDGSVRIEVGDLDHDGDLDLVNLGSFRLYTLFGHGNGTFAPATTYSLQLGATPNQLVVADFDGDTNLDVVVGEHICCPAEIFLLRGQNNGTFAAPETVGGSNQVFSALGAGALDADAETDLVWLGYSTAFPQQPNRAYALYGHGDGTFDPLAAIGNCFWPLDVEIADVDANSAADIVVANSLAPGTASIHLGGGDGTFDRRLDFGIDGQASAARTADLNGDGGLDLVVADRLSPKVWVMLNQGAQPTDTGPTGPEVVASRSRFVAVTETANGALRIDYALAPAALRGRVDLAIFDVRGRRLQSYVDATTGGAQRTRVWERDTVGGGRAPRGVYFVRLRTLDGERVSKTVLLRP
jgi:hypothetical protein